MPYAVLEKEIEKLDETQRNTVVLFVRFLLSQKVEGRRRESEIRSQRTSEIKARLHALVERTSPREGEPYKFNRADAYPEGVFA